MYVESSPNHIEIKKALRALSALKKRKKRKQLNV